MCANVAILPSEIAIVRYLNKIGIKERTQLLKDLICISNNLYNIHNILIPFDLGVYNYGADVRYSSESFERDLSFLISAGIISQSEGSIKYDITDYGRSIINEKYFNNTPEDILLKLDEEVDCLE